MGKLGDKAIIRDFTSGPVFGPLVRFSVPFMLSNALQVLYSTVDMLFVGGFVGHAGLAAVTNAGRVFVFMTMLGVGFSMCGQIYVAQLIGQGRRDALQKAIGTFFGTMLSIGAVLTVAGVLSTRWLLKAINIPEEAYDGAVSYLLVCNSGVIASFGYNMVSAVLRGMGDSRHPFLFVAVASVANIILDAVFIAGFGWGTFGAGLATILGQIISFVFSFVYLYQRRDGFGFDFRPKGFLIDGKVFAAQMRLGVPFAVRFAAINVSMMYVLRLVNGVGLAASTVFGVGVQMDDIGTKVTQGIMQAATGMVGQNYGARKHDRIVKIVYSAWTFSFGFYAVYTYFLLGHTEGMFRLFTDNADVIALAPVFAYNIVWQFPGLVLMRGTNAFVNGIGNARLALILGIVDGVVVRIGLSWLLGSYLGMGLRGYVLGYALACYGLVLPSLCYFYIGKWRSRALVTA